MAKKEIKPEDVFQPSQTAAIKSFIRKKAAHEPERRLRNELLAIQYRIEDYIESDQSPDEHMINMLDFVKMYLKTLKITKKELAKHLNMRDSNLHKYLVGDRKLSPEIALKISSFTHTKPEYWYRIQIKNQLIELRKQKHNAGDYSQYDFKKLIQS